MTFRISGNKCWCARCGEPLASPSWRDKTSHCCSRTRAENPVQVEPERVSERPSQARRAAPKPERAHCSNGHDWTPENLSTRSTGQLRCKVCDRERKAALKTMKEAS